MRLTVALAILAVSVWSAQAHEATEPHEHPPTPPVQVPPAPPPRPPQATDKGEDYLVIFVRTSKVGRIDSKRYKTLAEMAAGIAGEKNPDTRVIVVFKGESIIDYQVIAP